MQYREHHFQPDMHNEMRCDLCGEHVSCGQHLRAIAPLHSKGVVHISSGGKHVGVLGMRLTRKELSPRMQSATDHQATKLYESYLY